MMARRGWLNDDVLFGCALKSITRSIAHRVLVEEVGRVICSRLYETSRLWGLLHCYDEKQENQMNEFAEINRIGSFKKHVEKQRNWLN
jgi:hypothetical protein